MSQALQTISQETALVDNIPSLDISRTLTAIQTAITRLDTTTATMTNRIDALTTTMTNRIDALTDRIDNMDTRNLARVLNLRITAPDTTLEVISDTTGNVPQNYPETIAALRAMTRQNIDALLTFYRLQNTGTVENKRIRLAKHLGIRLS
ncbi:1205_t:CDS:2 [Paraglomus brasilianum]|uniref:1205_t:CDS:1 n=1 Tax=Paraglomus brasilianum TaxID=144538 RepID=A0A9N9DAB4_9GLOM|nr:1205_t:CDS:2 [Paraglomus brasilianum]